MYLNKASTLYVNWLHQCAFLRLLFLRARDYIIEFTFYQYWIITFIFSSMDFEFGTFIVYMNIVITILIMKNIHNTAYV